MASDYRQMAKRFLSVLIDTYNHERFIEKAIVSVLEQDFPVNEREILVVDDGSSDRTPEIVRQFEPHVRLLRKANGGQASAFNAGIPECKGEIVAFLDGDDWWAPKKLSKVAEAMAETPSVGIVGHGIIIVRRDGVEQDEILREGFRFQANTIEGGRLLRRRGSFLGTSRMTIRAEVMRQIGLVPESIKIQADEYLFTLAAVLSEVRILPETLAYYRLHDSNGFELDEGVAPEKLRHKQESLAELAKTLLQQMEQRGVSEPVRRTVMEYTEACADQLRLMLDGGWPWETAKTEWTLYRILHPDARISYRIFKTLMLMGAMVTPPRSFYRAQRALTQSDLYRRTRARLLPVPEMQHIQKERRARS